MGGGQSGAEAAAQDFGAETPSFKAHPMLLFDRRGAGEGASDVWYDDMVGADGLSECEAQAEDLAALMDHLQLPPAILIGFSSGARLFGMLALRHPERVRALVLVILTGGPNAAHQLGQIYYGRLAQLAKAGGMEAVLSDPSMRPKARVNEAVASYLRSLPPDRFVEAMERSVALFESTKHEPALGLPTAALANLTTPALIVHNRGPGIGDGMHMESVTRAVAAALPNAEPPVCSTELRVWWGAILRFVEKHGC